MRYAYSYLGVLKSRWPCFFFLILLSIFFHPFGLYFLAAQEDSAVEGERDASLSKDGLAGRYVRELGHEEYRVRNQAYRELLQLGREALVALQEGMMDPDPEVQARSQQLLFALRGRGLIGIRLREDWNGQIPLDRVITEEVFVNAGKDDGNQGYTYPVVVIESVMTKDNRTPFDGPMLGQQVLPAEKAGLQNGDLILAVNGRRIAGQLDLIREIGKVGPARQAVLLVEREGKKFTVLLIPILHFQDKEVPVKLEAAGES